MVIHPGLQHIGVLVGLAQTDYPAESPVLIFACSNSGNKCMQSAFDSVYSKFDKPLTSPIYL